MRPSLSTATIDDADDLSRLAGAVFPMACPAGMPAADLAHHIATALDPATFRQQLQDPRRTLWVARDEAGLQGYAMLTRGEPLPVAAPAYTLRPLQLQRLYVRASQHGSGLATRLLTQVVQQASAEGADALWLTTGNFNGRALAFYHRQGFAEIGTTLFPVGADLHTDYVLLRALPQAGR